MRTALMLAVALAVGAGCKKDQAGIPVMQPVVVSTAEQDALWQLAPANTRTALVMSPRGVAMLWEAFRTFRHVMAITPGLEAETLQLDEAMHTVIGEAEPTLGAFGLTAEQGFALFLTDDKKGIAVIPVGDREKFGAFAKMDALLQNCKVVGVRTVCALGGESLETLGQGRLRGAIDALGARGEVEQAGELWKGGLRTAIVAQLAPGAVVLRGAIEQVPPQLAQLFPTASRPRLEPGTAAFAMVDVRPLFALLGKRMPPPAAMFAAAIAGPVMITSPAGGMSFDLRVPLNDTSLVQQVIDHCDQIPNMNASLQNGACRLTVPTIDLEIEARIEGRELLVRHIGSLPVRPAPMSPFAGELAKGEWAVASYGHGTFLGLKIPKEMLDGDADSLMAARILPLVNELGFGLRIDGSTAHFVAKLRTAWANPPEVVAKLLAVDAAAVLAGKGPEAARAIAESAPRSPFAKDLAAGPGGVIGLIAPIGVAGVAVPAFLDGKKKPRRTEATLELHKIAQAAKAGWVTTTQLPQRAAPLTPATSCCQQDFGGRRRCEPKDAEWNTPAWRDLDFQMDQPFLFQYSYTPTKDGFIALAVGDLDCDGVSIEYRMEGKVVNGKLETVLTEPPPNSD